MSEKMSQIVTDSNHWAQKTVGEQGMDRAPGHTGKPTRSKALHTETPTAFNRVRQDNNPYVFYRSIRCITNRIIIIINT